MELRSLIAPSLLASLASLAFAGAAHADPIEKPPGKVVLPLSGLEVNLPKDARKGFRWALSGSYSYIDGGKSFDGRDVIDGKVGDKLVSGSWVHVGYFDAGDCGKVVAELDVPDRWTAESDLFGQHWSVAGGTWDFGDPLGKAPAIALCASKPNRASLLLYHFFLADRDLDKDKVLAAVGKVALFAEVTKAWVADKTGPSQPTQHPEIRRRGDIEASRKVHLDKMDIDVTVPDDGYLWLVRGPDPDVMSDFFDRMAPALPDVSLETARAPGATCDELFPASGPDAPKRKDEPAAKGVPEGWRSLGTMIVPSGGLERLVCREHEGVALVAGLLVTPADRPEGRDFGPLATLLKALAEGSDASPPPATPR